MITPDVCQQVLDKQAVQKSQHDQHLQIHIIDVGDLVMVKNYKQDHVSWTPGTVLEKYGITSFLITLSDDTIRRCHTDQIRKRQELESLSESDQSQEEVSEVSDSNSVVQEELESFEVITQPNSVVEENREPRYPQRHRCPPDRFF